MTSTSTSTASGSPNFEIPADKGSYDSFDQLLDTSLDQLKGIVEGLQQSADPTDPDQPKIAGLYASFMDEARVESLGLHPLDAEFARIDALKSPKELAAFIAHLNQMRVGAPGFRTCTSTTRTPPATCWTCSKAA